LTLKQEIDRRKRIEKKGKNVLDSKPKDRKKNMFLNTTEDIVKRELLHIKLMLNYFSHC
jgi:hypothetical protein